MENWDILYRLAAQRQCDAIAFVARERLMKAARDENNPFLIVARIHWYDRLLNRLGIILEGAGCRLQSRYARLTFTDSPCRPVAYNMKM